MKHMMMLMIQEKFRSHLTWKGWGEGCMMINTITTASVCLLPEVVVLWIVCRQTISHSPSWRNMLWGSVHMVGG